LKRTPIVLHPAHYDALDRLAGALGLSDSRRTNRQTLAFAIIQAVVNSLSHP
jgi:hypothetical protein